MPARFRRHPSPPSPSDAFRLITRLAEEKETSVQEALASVTAHSLMEEVLTHARTPIRLHGKRVEEMFAYVVTALGRAYAIKREETDDLIVPEGVSITVPDFRVMLPEQVEILIEVKNIHEKEPMKDKALKARYLERLAAYGRLFNRPVFLATYWSSWRSWTLHPVEELIEALKGGTVHFSFGEAYRRSHMRLLGDAEIGTEYPLTVRLDVTSQLLASDGSTSQFEVRIDRAALFVNGRRIDHKRDERIGFGFIFNGRWPESEHLTMKDDRVVRIEYSYAPIDPPDEQPFALVDSLSGLASGSFNSLTVSNGKVRRLRPRELPSPPYPQIGEKYHGTDLPLWILVLEPTTGWGASQNASGT
jgi:hypothetical protein